MNLPTLTAQASFPESAGQTARLLSLDAFRGATIAAMILVNNPGDGHHVYAQLQHAAWHGWTFTDTIFPSFIWIAGVAMTLSFARRIERGDSRGRLFAHTFRRAAIIFAIGVFLYLFPHFNLSTTRILGVLQRIAVCYLITAAIFLRTSWKGQLVWAIALLAAYWALMTLVPVPGGGVGSFERGRNLANWLDSVVLGRHNYRWTKTWDPEGLISTLPAIATMLLGVLAGQLLRLRDGAADKAAWLFAGGNALMIAGAVLSIWQPINKQLWTAPFAVFMAGLSASAFAFCYWVADGRGWRAWARPFAVFGSNAIVIYSLSEVLSGALDEFYAGGRNLHTHIYDALFAPMASPINASLIWAVAYVLVMYAVAYLMWRRKWFIKV